MASVHWSAARNVEQPSSRNKASYEARVNGWSNTGLVLPPLYMGLRLFVYLEKSSRHFSTMPWKIRGTLSPGQTVLSACRAAWPHPASPLCPAPTRPACGMSGFRTQQVGSIQDCCPAVAHNKSESKVKGMAFIHHLSSLLSPLQPHSARSSEPWSVKSTSSGTQLCTIEPTTNSKTKNKRLLILTFLAQEKM